MEDLNENVSVAPKGWGKRVSVTLLHERESEESKAGFVATTMGGTPRNAMITVEDPHSKEAALRELRVVLESMGFDGRIFVHDVTEVGYSQEYEA
jgi:hypothetical protein